MSQCDFYKDCSKVPIPNRCVEYCLAQLLRNTTAEEKRLVLGLAEDTAAAVSEAYQYAFIPSFTDLKNKLTEDQADELLQKFKTISQFQLDYFHKSQHEKDIIISMFRNQHLDLDNNELMATSTE